MCVNSRNNTALILGTVESAVGRPQRSRSRYLPLVYASFRYTCGGGKRANEHIIAASRAPGVARGGSAQLGAQFFRLLTAIFIPLNSPKMPFPHSKMVTFLDLETGCCCKHFLKCICALKYNKNYGRRAARTKPSRQVGGFTQKSSIFH